MKKFIVWITPTMAEYVKAKLDLLDNGVLTFYSDGQIVRSFKAHEYVEYHEVE